MALRRRSSLLSPLALVLFFSFGGASVKCAQQPPSASEEKKPEKPGPPEPVTIRIEVTAGDNNKPVEAASIYVRYNEAHKIKADKLVEMNVKTTPEGRARVPLVPKGKILIQVIAKGYQTFGDTFEVNEAEKTIEVKLNPPQPQVSAHQ